MKKISPLLLFVILQYASVYSQTGGAPALLTTSKKAMDAFMDLRFGMFIHFGPVTLRGTEIGWSRNTQVTQNDYDSLYREFDPALFNADTWARTAKDAGMKYMTITAKHHDGFCLWPTAVTDYNISNGPFRRDIVGELATACRKQGIKFCIYFTVLDWHDPYYYTRNSNDSSKKPNADMDVFVGRMKSELKELITRYHPTMLWFDGNWEKAWTIGYGRELYQYIKKLDPDVIINNRLGKGGDALGAEAAGDYLTPEQTIGGLNMKQPWESCITICNQWAWLPNDKMKSLQQCIQTLVRSAAGNGNLLFNVGPMMDGRMEARQIARLREMGDWLKKYGQSIYSTKGGPYPPNNSFATTRKGNKIYLHIFEKKAILTLPPIPGIHILKAAWMNGGDVSFTQDEQAGYKITLPADLPDPNSAVIVLELNKNAEELPVVSN